MAFEEILAPYRARSTPGQVTVASHKAFRGHYALCVSIPKNALEELGWSKGDRVKLALGTGADVGWLRITSGGSEGFSLIQANASSTNLIFKTVALSDGERHSGQPVENFIQDGALYIRLPEWCDTTNGAYP